MISCRANVENAARGPEPGECYRGWKIALVLDTGHHTNWIRVDTRVFSSNPVQRFDKN